MIKSMLRRSAVHLIHFQKERHLFHLIHDSSEGPRLSIAIVLEPMHNTAFKLSLRRWGHLTLWLGSCSGGERWRRKASSMSW